ncbi:GNAT family N-acetyltransferase [Roseateles cellulosilyticus]|uniref:GNAT family N-acetyltransferase n=1 Tax=Pelomonas cellulosilytica TaxID=2906762 RepID=A0ABS8XUH5_9BURK|nr:GNAT family N-acetyltransferase [Pelomonas sp. P8]MCE4556337.1 GNAT family N-acetyltransferase [Pelomonas sp. P8]
MPADLKIRPARASDAAPLAAFATRSFTDTYRGLDDPQDIADYVAEHFRPDVVAGILADSACTVLLAEADGALAGYAIVRDIAPPACVTRPAPLQLWRLYLGTDFIGHGLGSRLMAAAHAEAYRRGGQTLWLGVYDRNVRAVEFYKRAGFRQVGTRDFLFGGRIYIDPIYAAPVRPPTQETHP